MNQTTSCNQECYQMTTEKKNSSIHSSQDGCDSTFEHQKIVFNIWLVLLIRESASNNNIDTEDNACK